MIKLQLIKEGQDPIIVEVRDEIQEAAFIKEGFKPVEQPKKGK